MSGVVWWFKAIVRRECERGCGCAIEPGDRTAYLPDDDHAVVCLHLRKIDMSDAVFVLNVGGDVGSSTRREIAHARATGKGIVWMFPDASDDTPGHAFRFGDRVEWNPRDDVWEPGSVEQVDTCSVVIALDENRQIMRVSPRNLRPLGSGGRS